jgi:CBS domain-containing protein
MPNEIGKSTVREVKPLALADTVATAAHRVTEAGLPALPVVDDEGRFAGIFGEREFMTALFPGYLGDLTSARVISRDIDSTIERREACREEPIAKYLTTDHIVVDDDYSDTQLAETFLHHRVLIIPVATEGTIKAVVTRHDFFRELVARFMKHTAAGDHDA